MPKSEHINCRRRGAIVEMVLDPSQVNPPDVSENGVNSSRAYVGMRRDKGEGTFELFANGIGCIGTVFSPPLEGFVNLASGSLCDANR